MIAVLVELDANGLCLQWRDHLGGTPPAHLARWLLMKILAYRIRAGETCIAEGPTNSKTAGRNEPGRSEPQAHQAA